MHVRSALVGIDFTATSRAALNAAARSVVGPEGLLLLHHVVDQKLLRLIDRTKFDTAGLGDQLRESAVQQLTLWAEQARAKVPDGVEVDTILSIGSPYLELVRMARDFDVDLIVMGGHDLREDDPDKLLFGSTAEKVLRGAPCAVLCVPSRGEIAAQ